jgi:hypothetical protein
MGSALTAEDTLQPADTALVLEGSGKESLEVAEGWRTAGLVRDVVVLEAPIRTHDLVAYWSDFVRWGFAPAPTTPAEFLHVVRAPSTQTAEQARAALPTLQALGSRSVDIPGGGGIGSRLVARELDSVLQAAGISQRLVRYGDVGRPPSRWWQSADDRRAVLDTWLQILVPYLSGYEPVGS